jgi:hypothetical protein
LVSFWPFSAWNPKRSNTQQSASSRRSTSRFPPPTHRHGSRCCHHTPLSFVSKTIRAPCIATCVSCARSSSPPRPQKCSVSTFEVLARRAERSAIVCATTVLQSLTCSRCTQAHCHEKKQAVKAAHYDQRKQLAKGLSTVCKWKFKAPNARAQAQVSQAIRSRNDGSSKCWCRNVRLKIYCTPIVYLSPFGCVSRGSLPLEVQAPIRSSSS